MIEEIKNMRAWVRRARVGGEVIIGRLPQGKKLRSIRCAANVVTRVRDKDCVKN
jgi:hypothetical protein